MNGDLKKNYILFLALSVLVIVAYSALFGKSEQEKRVDARRDAASGRSEAASGSPAETAPAKDAPRRFERVDPSYEPRTVKVRSKLFAAEIDTLGGKVAGWKLAGYRESVEPDSLPVEVVRERKNSFDAVLAVRNERMPELLPFSYRGDEELEVGPDGLDVVMVWKRDDGLSVRKTLSFLPDRYFVGEKLEVLNGTGGRISQKVYVNWTNSVYEDGTRGLYEFVAMVGGEVERIKKTLKEARTLGGEVAWFGFSDKYFISSFLPEIGGDQGVSLEPLDGKGLTEASFSYPEQKTSPGKTYSVAWKSYFGPKNVSDLREAGYGLEKSIDYGYVGGLTKVAVDLLKFVNDFFSNYGISIIVLTFLLRLVFLPLTVKSMKSMKAVQYKMQKIKPQIDALKEKYKDDKPTQQSEMMKLYSSNDINPLSSLGGCLPLLVQFPVFIALYFALLYSIDLRHSSFLWVADLSQPEHLFDVAGVPFRILPIAMGVSWFLSQRLTPMTSPGSETMELQMKLMQFMPIIFTVMFWGLPSGLILYWTVSNILSIGQQLYINRKVPAPEGG